MNRSMCIILLLTQCQYNAKRVQASLDLDLDMDTADGKVCSLSEKDEAYVEATYGITFRFEGDCSANTLKCRPSFLLAEVVPKLFSHVARGDWCTCSSSHVKDSAGQSFEFDFRITGETVKCSSPSCWNMYSDAKLHDKRAENSQISGSGPNRLNTPDHWDGKCVESSWAKNSGLPLPLMHEQAVVKNVRVVTTPVIESGVNVKDVEHGRVVTTPVNESGKSVEDVIGVSEDVVDSHTDADGCKDDDATRLACMLAVGDITGDDGTGNKGGRWKKGRKSTEQQSAFKTACSKEKCCSTQTPKGAYICAPKRSLQQPALNRAGEAHTVDKPPY